MIGDLIKNLFGSKNDRELKDIQPVVDMINSIEPDFKKLTDDQSGTGERWDILVGLPTGCQVFLGTQRVWDQSWRGLLSEYMGVL